MSGAKVWYSYHKLHRINGPAIENSNGHKEWYQHGKLHRLDGPAVVNYNGDKNWYFHGEYIESSSQEEFENKIKLVPFW